MGLFFCLTPAQERFRVCHLSKLVHDELLYIMREKINIRAILSGFEKQRAEQQCDYGYRYPP